MLCIVCGEEVSPPRTRHLDCWAAGLSVSPVARAINRFARAARNGDPEARRALREIRQAIAEAIRAADHETRSAADGSSLSSVRIRHAKAVTPEALGAIPGWSRDRVALVFF
jgi:hypothetical protein